MNTKREIQIFRALFAFILIGTTILAGSVYGQEYSHVEFKHNDSIVLSVPYILWEQKTDSVELTLPAAVYHWRIVGPDSTASRWELYLTIPAESTENVMGRDTSIVIKKYRSSRWGGEYEEF